MRHHVVGCGRWGTWLARRLQSRTRRLASLCNRTGDIAQRLAQELHVAARPWQNWSSGLAREDCVWLTLSDDALPSAHAALARDGCRSMVLQASGAAPLNPAPYPTGVVWPLMSISAVREPAWSSLTCVVEAGGAARYERLAELTEASIEPARILRADSGLRARLHLGAVLTQNFTNLLWDLAADQLPADTLQLLVPLASAHLEAIRAGTPPADLQTGPAVRGDVASMERHERLLQDHDQALAVYRMMSGVIASRSKETI